ncbi:PREDICTED: glycine-rich cell wall structural protein 1.8-like, partial [Rhagoletis zephyria]|uniref:glycine-rich cell wall structural protein 1.8-like n=1 Tax=Rhagoletis zephyria TaxID=28612 RepID=UPI0008117B61
MINLINQFCSFENLGYGGGGGGGGYGGGGGGGMMMMCGGGGGCGGEKKKTTISFDIPDLGLGGMGKGMGDMMGNLGSMLGNLGKSMSKGGGGDDCGGGGYVQLYHYNPSTYLWHKETAELHRSAETHQRADEEVADLGDGAQEDEHRQEGQPDDAGSVIGEGNVARLVEALRALARLEGVHRAETDENQRVEQAEEVGGPFGAGADEHRLVTGRVDELGGGRVVEDPGDVDGHLDGYQQTGYDQLRARRGEARLGRRAVAEDARDPIGLRDDGRVADGVAEAEEEAVEGAGKRGGAGNDDEGHGEGEEDAGQVEVAEFAAGRLDHRRLGEAAENQPGGDGGQHARRGDAHRDDGPPVGEGQVQR